MPIRNNATRSQKMKQIIISDEAEVASSPKENQEQEVASIQKPPAKKRGRKKKVPVVEDDKFINDNDQQNVSPTPKITAKRKTVPKQQQFTIVNQVFYLLLMLIDNL